MSYYKSFSVFFNTFLAKNLSQTDWQNLNWLRFLSYSKIVLRFFIYCAKIMLRVFHMLRFLRYFIRLILASKQGNHLDNYSNLKKNRAARAYESLSDIKFSSGAFGANKSN